MAPFTRSCGYALMAGGGLLALLNLVLSPFLPTDQGEAVLRTSDIYLARLSAAELSTLLLLLGCFGLHAAQRATSGLFGKIAFALAFVGTGLMVGVEWANIFVLRAIAQTSPDALGALDDALLLQIGYASAAGLFMLGWLLLAISVWRTRLAPRWAPVTAISGIILIPLLGASPLGVFGAIAGNVCFGAGLVGIGYAMTRGSVTLLD